MILSSMFGYNMLRVIKQAIKERCCLVVQSQSKDSVLHCDKVIFVPGKGQLQQSEHQLKRIFQSHGKMSWFSLTRPWTCKVTNSSRLQPIILIQLLVVKIANLSDVCVIRENLLLALVENWRPALDWVAGILCEVDNLFIKLFSRDLRNIRSAGAKNTSYLLICWQLLENVTI